MYWLKSPERNKGSHLMLDSFGHLEPWEDRISALKALQKAVNHLDQSGVVDFWVSSGAALGMNRSVKTGGPFLPYPKAVLDIDILIDGKISLTECEEILPDWRLFNVRGTTEDVMNIHLCDWEDTKILISFWFYKKVTSEKEFVLKYYDCSSRYDYFHREEDYERNFLNFENFSFPFFCDPDKYCRIRYGQDWKTPKQTIGTFAHGSPNTRR